MITKNEMRAFRDMPAEAYRLHDGVANGSVILTSLLAGGMLLMAIGGLFAGREPYRDAPSEMSAAERMTSDASAFTLMSTASPQLPVRPQDEPAF